MHVRVRARAYMRACVWHVHVKVRGCVGAWGCACVAAAAGATTSPALDDIHRNQRALLLMVVPTCRALIIRVAEAMACRWRAWLGIGVRVKATSINLLQSLEAAEFILKAVGASSFHPHRRLDEGP